ncbi:MAG: thiamine phosphate synthase [Alphaproteobacteria bacterium]
MDAKLQGFRKRKSAPWGLYAILDPAHCAGRDLAILARQVLENGAGALQLRDKKGDEQERTKMGRRLKALCEEFGAMFIINDDPCLAREVDADGVHVGQDDAPIAEARAIVGRDRVVGLSTHTREQALAGCDSGADYLGFGPIYATATKTQPYPPLGAEEVRWAAETLILPFVAIGGVTRERLPELVEAGVKNVAAISAIFAAEDPGRAARQFVEVLAGGGIP